MTNANTVKRKASTVRLQHAITKSQIPSPAPDPERAIYGFFLLILAVSLFLLYVFVAYLPPSVLHECCADYLPQRYWFIAVPAQLVFVALAVVPIYMSLNMMSVNAQNSSTSVQDEHTLLKENVINDSNQSSFSIDPIYDIPITAICEYLYLKEKK